VRQADAIGGIDVERLRLGGALAAGSRVAHVANAHVAVQPQHVAGVEDIPYQAVVLAQMQVSAVAGHDARCVLAAMLQHGQSVIDCLVYGGAP